MLGKPNDRKCISQQLFCSRTRQGREAGARSLSPKLIIDVPQVQKQTLDVVEELSQARTSSKVLETA